MWPSARWGLKWQHALAAVVGGAAVGYPCAQVVEHCGWDGGCPHRYFYLAGFFVGLTAFLAGVLAFGLIAVKVLITKLWALIRS